MLLAEGFFSGFFTDVCSRIADGEGYPGSFVSTALVTSGRLSVLLCCGCKEVCGWATSGFDSGDSVADEVDVGIIFLNLRETDEKL